MHSSTGLFVVFGLIVGGNYCCVVDSAQLAFGSTSFRKNNNKDGSFPKLKRRRDTSISSSHLMISSTTAATTTSLRAFPSDISGQRTFSQYQARSKPSILSTSRLSSTRNQSDHQFFEDSPSSSSSNIMRSLLQAAVMSLLTLGFAAMAGYLPGPVNPTTGATEIYTSSMILQDSACAAGSGILAGIFVKLVTTAAKRGIVQPRDSRKIIHAASAPLFLCVWPLFSQAQGARFFAAVVPLVNMVKLYLAGTGKAEEDLVAAVSRSGKKEEVLQGPFFYIIVILLATLLFWKDNLIGIIAVSTMAAGDGMADIFGRRFGKNNKWFFNDKKSIAGSLAFAMAASLSSIALSWWFLKTGSIASLTSISPLRIVALSVLSAIVEVLPWGDDNLSVPVASAVLASIML